MDRKEAADLLDNLIGMVEDSHGADYDTALRMGIEALSAHPEIIACGQGELVQDGSRLVQDLISRQAAVDALDKRFDDVPMELTAEILQLRRDLRKRIPSAQPDHDKLHLQKEQAYMQGWEDARLIDRQAAIDALAREDNKHPFRNMKFSEIAKCVRELPSAQPEIIRCKDCKKLKHCRTTNIWAVAPDDDWFCADAERRTDETTI